MFLDHRLGLGCAFATIRHSIKGDPFTKNFTGHNPYLQDNDRKSKKIHIKKIKNNSEYDLFKDKIKDLKKDLKFEKKQHKQNNTLYNEHINRLETKLTSMRKLNKQLLIQLSSLTNEIITLKKVKKTHGNNRSVTYEPSDLTEEIDSFDEDFIRDEEENLCTQIEDISNDC